MLVSTMYGPPLEINKNDKKWQCLRVKVKDIINFFQYYTVYFIIIKLLKPLIKHDKLHNIKVNTGYQSIYWVYNYGLLYNNKKLQLSNV